MPNQLKIDPTRTTMLRKKFVADMNRRFKKLSRAIQELVVDDDAFGLAADDSFLTLTNRQVEKQAWRFRTNTQKIKAYRKWLQEQIDANILTTVGGISDKPWTATYIESAYRKGAVRAYVDVHAEELAEDIPFYLGGKAQFLRETFTQPEILEKIELLYTRAFEELRGVTTAMSQQMSRILADGLSQGYGPKKIARNLKNNVAKLNKTRARVIARTEIIRAHAEGQLDAFERLGVKELRLMAEWSTAGDERVCAECGELEGVVMTIDEARGLVPRHPNCRCMWIPASKDRKETGQLWGRKKDRAIEKSIRAEGGIDLETGRFKKSLDETKPKSVWLGKESL